MAAVEGALHMASLGFSVFPIEWKGKHPLVPWAQFQKRRASEQEIKDWWSRWPEANIGIACGAVSDLFVVDIDGPEGINSAAELHLTPTWICETGKGFHFYYRYPGPVAKNAVRAKPGIDIRTDGGFVVGPGSIHASGKVYVWGDGSSPNECERQPIAMELIEKIIKQQPREIRPIEPTKFIPATEGQRNDSAARIVGYLIRKKLTRSDIGQIMWLWNAQNVPPIRPSELDAVIESIWKREPGGSPSEIDFHPVPLTELINKTPTHVNYLWEPFIETNGIALLVAMPKVGKSVFCAHLAKAVVEGKPFLDRPVRQGRTLMIELEESNQRLIARCRDLGMGRDVFVHLGSIRTTEELYRKIEEYIIREKIVLVIINTLVRFLNIRDENDARQISEAVAPILDLRQRLDCAFLMVHHTNKFGEESPRSIRGSSDLFASVDTAMLLRSDDPVSPREMLSWGRDPAIPFRITMRLDQNQLMLIPNIEKKKKVSLFHD